MPWTDRISTWLGVDDTWQRPAPTSWRADAVAVIALLGLVEAELLRSYVPFDSSRARLLGAGTLLVLPLVWRRRHPLVVAVVCAVGLFIAGTFVPEVPYLTSLSVATFFATFSGLAWARDRRSVPLVVGGIMVLIFGWFAVLYTWGHGVRGHASHRRGRGRPRPHPHHLRS